MVGWNQKEDRHKKVEIKKASNVRLPGLKLERNATGDLDSDTAPYIVSVQEVKDGEPRIHFTFFKETCSPSMDIVPDRLPEN